MRFSNRFLATLAVLGLFTGCARQADPAEQSAEPGESQALAPDGAMSVFSAPTAAPTCHDDGYLQARLFGALEGPIDWSGAEMACSGMPRPNSAGARLRFAGQAGEQRIAIIIALADLKRDAAGTELSSKVTMIDESSGRFFSTWDLENCWTDISSVVATDGSGDRVYIEGDLYCVAPLAEVNGSGSVSIADLSFAGSLDWTAK